MKITLLTLLLLWVGIFQPADPLISAKDYDVHKFHRGKQSSKSPKRVYIQSFRAMFEVFEQASASTKSTTNDRANRSSMVSGTKTSMGVQLSGVDIPDFQKIVDEAYADFVTKLEEEGFEIISAEEAGKTDYFSGYTKVSGGATSTDQISGFVMVTPQGYDYWVKGISNSGREKSTFTDTSSKLSKDLGDAYVAEATFIFPFVELDASSVSWGDYAASKVKAKVALKLASMFGADDNESDKLGSITGFAGKFANVASGSQLYYSKVRFIAGDMINNPVFDSTTGLKKDVYFEGAFSTDKIVETTTASVDRFSKGAYPQLVMVSGDQLNLASHYAEANPDKFLSAVKGSMNEMLTTGMSNFTDLMKK